MHRTHSLDAVIISFGIYHYDIIIKIKQSPAIGADSLVVRLNQIGTTFSIAAARQLHHLSPLVEASKFVALGGIVVIAIALYLGIVILVVFAEHHIADIQVLSHYSHRGNLTHSIRTRYCYIVVATAIARIRKCLITIFTNTPIFR